MTLHPDWRAILRRAWSLRLVALAALLSGAEVVCSVLQVRIPVPPLWFAALSGLVSCGAFAARLLAQSNMACLKEPER